MKRPGRKARKTEAKASKESAEPASEVKRGRSKASKTETPKAVAKAKAKGKKAEKPNPAEEVPAGNLTAKEKRRVQAKGGVQRLQAAAPPDLFGAMPNNLEDKTIFTVKDPNNKGSSVGVILNSRSFYVSHANKPNPSYKVLVFSTDLVSMSICIILLIDGFGQGFKGVFMCFPFSPQVDKKKGVTIPWGVDLAQSWLDAKTIAAWACPGY